MLAFETGRRQGELGRGRSARHRQDQQPDERRRAADVRAGPRLGRVSRRRRASPSATTSSSLEKTAIRDIAALYATTPLETLKAWEAFHVADQAAPYLSKRFVDSRFDVHEDAQRRARSCGRAGSAARRSSTRRSASCSAAPTSSTYFPRVVEGDDDRAGREPEDRDGRAHPEERLDERRRRRRRRSRSSSKMDVMVGYPGQVARLLDARRSTPPTSTATSQRSNRSSSGSTSSPISASRSTTRSGAMTPQTVERLQRRPREQDRLPRRHPAGAVLRSDGRPGGELRRHRRDHRPRDQPRLRRPGPQDRRDRRRRATGGRRPTPIASTRRRSASARSTTPTSRCPACTSTAS